ncbi:MAG: hypothetical protein L3J51_12270 [Cocleimonas sp.]|nr:hypothetical protein [Cocleimonas sp.]
MKVIIDECLPKSLNKLIHNKEVWTVPQIGLAGYNDNDLLNELDVRNIDVFITIDGNIEYQQSFIDRKFGTVIIRSVTNRLSDLLQLENELNDAINDISSGNILHIP